VRNHDGVAERFEPDEIAALVSLIVAHQRLEDRRRRHPHPGAEDVPALIGHPLGWPR
jgi:hypothetical protein